MKKITAFLLLAFYLFSATNASELVKLPLLVHHYYKHWEENKNIGFISFLTMHYYTECDKDIDNDAKEDNQLPFKSIVHCSALSFIAITTPLLFFEVLSKPEAQIKPSFVFGTDFFLPSQSLASIWQPPRHY